MSNPKREIECINRLQTLTGSFDDIIEFLTQEGLVNKETIKVIKGSPEVHKAMHTLLRGLSTEGKLQLLEYEWSILPVERIKITVVTDRTQHEFCYNF